MGPTSVQGDKAKQYEVHGDPDSAESVQELLNRDKGPGHGKRVNRYDHSGKWTEQYQYSINRGGY